MTFYNKFGSTVVRIDNPPTPAVPPAPPPRRYATVVRSCTRDNVPYLTITIDGQLFDVQTDPAITHYCDAGTTVLVKPETGEITAVLQESLELGDIFTVKKIISTALIQVEGIAGMLKVISWSKKRFPKIKEGSLVAVDRGQYVVMADHGWEEPKRPFQGGGRDITWSDIGGLEEAKADLREAIELPLQYPALFRSYNKKPMRGILLEGPAGTGKSLLASAVAFTLKQSASAEFIYVKGPEFLDKFIGNAEKKIKLLFDSAREYKARTGNPTVIFIDEADAILSKRGTGISMDMNRTIVPAFLAEMDGLEDSGAFVLLATNKAKWLDPAVVRDGRMDRIINVPRPDATAARAILAIHLRNKPLKEDQAVVSDWLIRQVYEVNAVVKQVSWLGRQATIGIKNLISGAMLAGIVDKASSIALRRDVENKSKIAVGIGLDDIETSLAQTISANARLNLDNEIEDLLVEELPTVKPGHQ